MRWNMWVANGHDCTNDEAIETTDVAGIEAITIGTEGGANASLRLSKTDLGWKSGDVTVGQGVPLLDVPDPWTENVVAQEMNLTTKGLWSESAKETVNDGKRTARGEMVALITRGDE